MIKSIVILGGGSAGFLTALTLKKRLPNLPVTVIRSPDIGIIGVGEGTTGSVCYHIHNYIGIDIKEFYRLAEPQWKLGIRFEWGPRPYFNYVFGYELDTQYNLLPKATGFYLDDDDFDFAGMQSGLMTRNRVFLRNSNGMPKLHPDEFTYHLENEKLVAFFERVAERIGLPIIDATVEEVLQNEHGVAGLRLSNGQTVTGDLYVDASGFSSLLLGKTLKEPFHSFNSALYCDRAVVGGWTRQEEPIKPYTTATTMNAGWCWQIEHEHRINRGYVYSSAFLSDDEAEREFRAQNPKIDKTRIVRFRSGIYERVWVKNVVAVGNALAFVEPLEATSLASICVQSQAIAELLYDAELDPPKASIEMLNYHIKRAYISVRDFLAVHYRFNRRLDTPFWRECLEKVELGAAEVICEHFKEMGPTVLWRRTLFQGIDHQEFGMEGYLAMLVGQKVPYRRKHTPTDAERQTWGRIRQAVERRTAEAYTVPEALALVRSDLWQWPARFYDRSLGERR